jgi:hypothetical protein
MEKVQTRVKFPTTDFNASSMAYESNTLPKPPIYNLFAVCDHEGNTMSSGHYTATCFEPHSKSWYSFNDKRVQKLSEPIFDETKAYILFYVKKDEDDVVANNEGEFDDYPMADGGDEIFNGKEEEKDSDDKESDDSHKRHRHRDETNERDERRVHYRNRDDNHGAEFARRLGAESSSSESDEDTVMKKLNRLRQKKAVAACKSREETKNAALARRLGAESSSSESDEDTVMIKLNRLRQEKAAARAKEASPPTPLTTTTVPCLTIQAHDIQEEKKSIPTSPCLSPPAQIPLIGNDNTINSKTPKTNSALNGEYWSIPSMSRRSKSNHTKAQTNPHEEVKQ